jgi:hypothetical protein
MDETIAELYSVFYFLDSLTFKKDDSKLMNAYRHFVKLIAKQEKSDNVIGILRPGIFGIMERLSELQTKGIVDKVVIFSNNGHLESLHFIRDVIHEAIGSDILIADCIHLNHPERNNSSVKDWKNLLEILNSGPCNAPLDLKPKSVYFFDDLYHPNMIATNYVHVPGYDKKASFDRIKDIYLEALEKAGFNNEDKKKLVEDILKRLKVNNTDTSLDNMFKAFKNNTTNTLGRNDIIPFVPDTGILLMNVAINKAVEKGVAAGVMTGVTTGGNSTKTQIKKRKISGGKRKRLITISKQRRSLKRVRLHKI